MMRKYVQCFIIGILFLFSGCQNDKVDLTVGNPGSFEDVAVELEEAVMIPTSLALTAFPKQDLRFNTEIRTQQLYKTAAILLTVTNNKNQDLYVRDMMQLEMTCDNKTFYGHLGMDDNKDYFLAEADWQSGVVLKPQEKRSLYFYVFCPEEMEEKTASLKISCGKEQLNGSIELKSAPSVNTVTGDDWELALLALYADDENYGVTVTLKNQTKQTLPINVGMQNLYVMAMTDLWQGNLLETILKDKGTNERLESGQEGQMNLVKELKDWIPSAKEQLKGHFYFHYQHHYYQWTFS